MRDVPGSRTAGCTLVVLVLLSLCGPASTCFADEFAAGSLIIPMDTTYQDLGMLKAYGLVYDLLRHGVPVRWVIRQGKSCGGVDFTTSAEDLQSGAVILGHGYRGGPFVIDAADAAAALPLVAAWQAANANTKVHRTTAAFSADVARTLVAAPRVAVFADGGESLARANLTAAGIPDSTLDPAWPITSPDLLTPVEVAGPTTTDHRDGALFDEDGDPVYGVFASMHWLVTSAQDTPEAVAETRQFLNNPVRFFAQCEAVLAFENLIPYGHFLTPDGLLVRSQPSSVDFHHCDTPPAQVDGAFGITGGSTPACALPAGDSYKAADVAMIVGAAHPEGAWDVWVSGYLDGVCPPSSGSCSGLGKVGYLGGHQYTTNLPVSSNPKTQGVRLFLNALFDSAGADLAHQPLVLVVKTAPATTTSAALTFTLDYRNSGESTALDAVLSDTLPPSSTFVSATGGGVYSGGKVAWALGNLGRGESGSVSFTVNLGGYGTYPNSAHLDYYSGLTLFDSVSNSTSTDYIGILGVVPDRPSLGTPFRVQKNATTPGHLDLSWGDSCGASQTDFAVYEGLLGSWYSHAGKLCGTGGALHADDLAPAASDAYYLVVPRSATAEGSYGTASSGAEIPQGSAACVGVQDTMACP